MVSVRSLDESTVSVHRRNDIQGLRAVAVLVVLVFHAGLYLPGGFIGVDVFFVISGFVITGMLHREWAAKRRIRFRAFYLKRFLRLTPALAVMVAFSVITSAVVLSPFGPQQTTGLTAGGSLLLAANFAIASTTGGYFDGPASGNPLLHTWSLSVEEQFYVVFPAILAAGWYLSKKFPILRSSTFLIVTALTGASFLVAMRGPELFGTESWLTGFYSPLTRAWEFGVGALLALAVTRFAVTSRALASAMGIAGASAVLASLFLISEATDFPSKWTVLPVVGALALLAAGTNQANIVTRFLSTRPMVKVGDWSYSLYLWHWPFIVFASVLWPGSLAAKVLACALSALPALASYKWVETPYRSVRGFSPWKFFPLAAATLVVPLALSGALTIAADNSYWNDRLSSFQTGNDAIFSGSECFTDQFATLNAPEDCQLNEGGTGRPVYLVGDSNALMFTSGLLAASEMTSSAFTSYSFGGCPVLDGGMATWAGSGAVYRPTCDLYQESVFSWLDDSAPGTVFLGSADYYLRDPSLGLDIGGGEVVGLPEKLIAYTDGLEATVAELQAAGHRVVVIMPIPNFRMESEAESLAYWDGPQSCPNVALLFDFCSSDMDMSLGTVTDRQGVIWSAVAQAATDSGAELLDLTAEICPNEICSIARDGMPIFADFNHISTLEATSLAPIFAKSINAD